MNDLGLLISRIAPGAGFAAHGAQKAFGAFEGPGPKGAALFLSGSLIAPGLGGPLGPAALISTMVVAQTSAHAKNGFFAQKGEIELGVTFSAGALALASAGYGRYSLDERTPRVQRRAGRDRRKRRGVRYKRPGDKTVETLA